MLYCRFLYHKESAEYRYYEAQLCQAEAAKKGSAGPIVAAAAPYPGKASLISLQHRFTASLFQIMLSNHTPLWRLSCFLAMAPMVVLTLTPLPLRSTKARPLRGVCALSSPRQRGG